MIHFHKPILDVNDVEAQSSEQHRRNAVESKDRADRVRQAAWSGGADWNEINYWQQDALIEATLAQSAHRPRWGRRAPR